MTARIPGLHICLEGPDHAGKTTQATRLAKRLHEATSRRVRVQAFPTDTPLGHKARAATPSQAQPLFRADYTRAWDDYLTPWITTGRHVITDRGMLSGQAYGHARPTDLLVPSLTLIFHTPNHVLDGRSEPTDHWETGPVQARARAFYATTTQGIHIDATGTPDEVEERIWAIVAPTAAEWTRLAEATR